jgi:hypothetical protein
LTSLAVATAKRARSKEALTNFIVKASKPDEWKDTEEEEDFVS